MNSSAAELPFGMFSAICTRTEEQACWLEALGTNERVVGLLFGSEIMAAGLHRPLRPRLLMAEVLGTERAPFLICSVTHLSSSSSSASCCHQESSVTELLAAVDTLSRAYRGWHFPSRRLMVQRSKQILSCSVLRSRLCGQATPILTPTSQQQHS